jgi:hypothetical protein
LDNECKLDPVILSWLKKVFDSQKNNKNLIIE